MPRPEVVKRIWAYVKEHGLQDPEDRRFILCDDKMKPVFGDKVHMLYVFPPPSLFLSLSLIRSPSPLDRRANPQ